ncbi:hypothetical protein ACOMHN_031756 [Nucella lapillus]
MELGTPRGTPPRFQPTEMPSSRLVSNGPCGITRVSHDGHRTTVDPISHVDPAGVMGQQSDPSTVDETFHEHIGPRLISVSCKINAEGNWLSSSLDETVHEQQRTQSHL